MSSLIVGLGVVALLVVAMFTVGSSDKSHKREKIYKELKQCRKLMKGGESARKDCLIRMDVLLGKSLGYAGVKGRSVGDKLKNADKLFDRDLYNKLWEGHKFRNRVVHENESVSGRKLRSTVKYFSTAIKRLLK
jgi:hypothetical protein